MGYTGELILIKRILSLFIIVSFLFSTSSLALAASPQDDIATNKLKLQQMDSNIMETNKKVAALNIEVDKMKKEISKNNLDISTNSKLIDIEKTSLNKLTKELNEAQELANKRLRAMYINGYNENFILLLLSSESFSDFISKSDLVKTIISSDKKIFDSLIYKKNLVNESIKNLDEKAKQLQELKDKNDMELKQLNEKSKSLQELINQFNKEKASAAQIIKDNEEKLIAHAVSVVDSSSPTINDLKSALQTLTSLYPQISTDSVRKKTKTYIDSGNKKLAELIAKNNKPADNGNETYKATYTMTATAYTGGGYTALGLRAVRDPAGLSTIAVDPYTIPLGTKVYIPGYGYAICSDTGGAIKGNIIDLYLDSEEECINWGRRPVTLYVVAYPGEW